MKKALQRGRSMSLPAGKTTPQAKNIIIILDPNETSYVLLPYVVQNQLR